MNLNETKMQIGKTQTSSELDCHIICVFSVYRSLIIKKITFQFEKLATQGLQIILGPESNPPRIIQCFLQQMLWLISHAFSQDINEKTRCFPLYLAFMVRMLKELTIKLIVRIKQQAVFFNSALLIDSMQHSGNATAISIWSSSKSLAYRHVCLINPFLSKNTQLLQTAVNKLASSVYDNFPIFISFKTQITFVGL